VRLSTATGEPLPERPLMVKREQRRLFYVGLSRAKAEVHLTYSGWTQNQYGRRFGNGPSEFLAEIRDRLI
jgi:DNA helicase-2/ATP-dependent DNA helicase PcrA